MKQGRTVLTVADSTGERFHRDDMPAPTAARSETPLSTGVEGLHSFVADVVPDATAADRFLGVLPAPSASRRFNLHADVVLESTGERFHRDMPAPTAARSTGVANVVPDRFLGVLPAPSASRGGGTTTGFANSGRLVHSDGRLQLRLTERGGLDAAARRYLDDRIVASLVDLFRGRSPISPPPSAAVPTRGGDDGAGYIFSLRVEGSGESRMMQVIAAMRLDEAASAVLPSRTLSGWFDGGGLVESTQGAVTGHLFFLDGRLQVRVTGHGGLNAAADLFRIDCVLPSTGAPFRGDDDNYSYSLVPVLLQPSTGSPNRSDVASALVPVGRASDSTAAGMGSAMPLESGVLFRVPRFPPPPGNGHLAIDIFRPRDDDSVMIMEKKWKFMATMCGLLGLAYGATAIIACGGAYMLDNFSIFSGKWAKKAWAMHTAQLLLSWILIKPLSSCRDNCIVKPLFPLLCFVNYTMVAPLMASRSANYAGLRSYVLPPVVFLCLVPFCVWSGKKNKTLRLEPMIWFSAAVLAWICKADEEAWLTVPGAGTRAPYFASLAVVRYLLKDALAQDYQRPIWRTFLALYEKAMVDTIRGVARTFLAAW